MSNWSAFLYVYCSFFSSCDKIKYCFAFSFMDYQLTIYYGYL
ncbi:hypothetical protein CWATWH0005_463 [Crocosphaera watsonii WH 0005]|uniref:Uncharacterized protein n=1 Tax=Crocosphaera watsonii WH 0005 TaxID=423472 RepID=T2IPD9_CROWT|nr:hypothetical protein CWATWH0005_463 [Crocosphaera watsonii WH 0005]